MAIHITGIIYIIITVQTVSNLYMPVCDCNKAKTRGILDVNRPYYCQPNKAVIPHHRRFDTNYTLVTKQKPTTTWKGWSCKQWVKSKKIVGSFWIGSYDTTYNQETHIVSPLECWEMINNRKCGENAMQSGATSLSFTSSPVGEGKWYATREYHVLNCLAEEITLRQDTEEGPIESPFGMLNATHSDRQFNHNHNTIAWGEIKSPDAGATPLLHGMAYVELTQTDEKNNISRLIDNTRQIEITFFNNPDASETKNPIFAVEGMPKTFLLFPSDTNKILFRIYSNVFLPCKNLNSTKSTLCRTLPNENDWKESNEHRQTRSINSEIQFLLTHEDEEAAAGKRLYSISYAWGTLQLGTPRMIPNPNKTKIEKEVQVFMTYEINKPARGIQLYSVLDPTKPLPYGRHFEYIVDHTIRIKQTPFCMVALNNSFISFKNCTEKVSHWIYDQQTNQIICEENHLCITAIELINKLELSLILTTCSQGQDILTAQQWIFEQINVNPDIIENYPDTTLDEMETFRLEQRKAVTTTINSPIFGGLLKVNQGQGNIVWNLINWGLFQTGEDKNKKCVTYHGIGNPLTLEMCDQNWVRCQESLKKYITSNDPLVQTQTSVANCSNAATIGQALEYSPDFTIRPFNTNNCIKANSTMLILEHCADTSSIWGTFDHTGQFMASDRTGLEIPGTNRKCLTTKNGRLGLGHCHDRIRRQHFSFEYKNPHQTQTLSAAAIIAWHTEQQLNDKPLDKLPPIIQRETEDKGQTNKILTNQTLRQANASNTSQPSSPATKLIAVVTTAKATTVTTSVKTTTTTTIKPTSPIKPANNTTKETVKNGTLLLTKPIQIANQLPDKKPTEPPKANTTSPPAKPTTVAPSTTTTIRTLEKNSSTERHIEPPKKLANVTVEKPTEKSKMTTAKTPDRATYNIETVDRDNTNNQADDSKEKLTDLPKDIKEFNQVVQYQIGKMHEQYKQRIETEHENRLAKEIREMYCQLSTIKKTQAITLSQTNGILAAAALGLPVCSRIQGFGQTMVLQQCAVKTISLTAVETQCGFQPYFTYAEGNFTIGMDGWSIHPYSDCFWKSHYVNLNGNPFSWEHNGSNGEWVKQKPTIHTTHLDLIAEFEELKLNDFDFALKAHPAHNVLEMEQLNILNDLVGRLHETESKVLSDIVVTEEQDNTIGSMFSWFDTLKIMGLCTTGIIIFLIALRLIKACNIAPHIKNKMRRKLRKAKNKKRDSQIEEEMEEILALHSFPPPNNPEPIYNPSSIVEPTAVREYAPLPLESRVIPNIQPSAPIIQQNDLTTEGSLPASKNKNDRIYPSLATKLANFIPHIKFNQNSQREIKSDDKPECTGSHTTCSYVAGYGMVWEDLCKCKLEEEPGAMAARY